MNEEQLLDALSFGVLFVQFTCIDEAIELLLECAFCVSVLFRKAGEKYFVACSNYGGKLCIAGLAIFSKQFP